MRSAHETHADQRHAARRAPPGDRRRPEAARLRDRARRARAAQGQHLQGRGDARRAVAGGLLRRLRRRPPRLSAVQGDLAPVLPRRRRGQERHHQGRHPRRPGTAGPGGKGRARQQGCGAHHLRLAGRSLPGADAQQPARRRRQPAHRGRRPRGAEGEPRPARLPQGHEPDRPHRRHRPHGRRAAVGPELHAQAVDGDRRGEQGRQGRLPDLPGELAGHPRDPRLLHRRHRRDPDRHRRHLRSGAAVHEPRDARVGIARSSATATTRRCSAASRSSTRSRPRSRARSTCRPAARS